MKARRLIPERMDDPGLDRPSHRAALAGLRRLNLWTGQARLAWNAIRRLGLDRGRRSLTVLDAATGAGDVPVGLARRARRDGIKLRLSACDVSATALEFASEYAVRHSVPVHFFRHDLLKTDLPGSYDVILCAQFLHHLSADQASAVIERFSRAARQAVVIIDLVRSRRNLAQVTLATRLLTRSPVVRFDGPQSIRAAFTTEELRELANRAGLAHLSVSRHWPCRAVCTGRPRQTSSTATAAEGVLREH